jgi:hypothetical protein
LFSKEEIPNIDFLLSCMELSKGSIEERLQKTLGKRIVASKEINYNPLHIGFEAKLKGDDIVPLVVDMKHID